jgi:hypothetical protein
VTATLSADGGGAPVTVSVAVCVVPPNAAVMVTEVEALVAVVGTVNVALLLPDGMVMPVGTEATALLLLKVTSAPPAGAGALSVAVPVADVPPWTLAGLTVSAERDSPAAGRTVRSARFVTPPAVAVMVTVVVVDTATVETAKVAEVAPAGTTTKAGTLAIAGIPLDRAICVSVDVGKASDTVPVEPLVPVVEVGLSVTADGAWAGVAVTVSWADVVTPFNEAVTVTGVSVEVALVGIFSDNVGLPAAIVTVEGRGTTAGLLLVRWTTAPPVGASPLR